MAEDLASDAWLLAAQEGAPNRPYYVRHRELKKEEKIKNSVVVEEEDPTTLTIQTFDPKDIVHSKVRRGTAANTRELQVGGPDRRTR